MVSGVAVAIQCVLSAASAQESDAGSNAGPQSIVQLASCTLRMTSAARAVVAEP